MNPDQESSPVEIFDPHGDLKLIVGEEQVVFLVCSRALARSSPVWEAMLYGPFCEGMVQQTEAEWEIPLPEDDPDVFRTILSAVHGGFDEIPEILSGHELFSLTAVADKYDMVDALKPFWRRWVKHENPLRVRIGQDLIDYLCVCHKLGYGRGFSLAFSQCVMLAETRDDGQLCVKSLGPRNLDSDEYLWCWDILDHVSEARREVLKVLCTRIKAAMESLMAGSACPVQHTGDKLCDSIMLGALCRVMASRGLDHWVFGKMEGVEASTTRSPLRFLRLLSDMREETIGTSGMRSVVGKRKHENCSPWAKGDEDLAGDGIKVVQNFVLKHAEHLQRRAEESGLDPELHCA